jgi:hypothetical protein
VGRWCAGGADCRWGVGALGGVAADRPGWRVGWMAIRGVRGRDLVGLGRAGCAYFKEWVSNVAGTPDTTYGADRLHTGADLRCQIPRHLVSENRFGPGATIFCHRESTSANVSESALTRHRPAPVRTGRDGEGRRQRSLTVSCGPGGSRVGVRGVFAVGDSFRGRDVDVGLSAMPVRVSGMVGSVVAGQVGKAYPRLGRVADDGPDLALLGARRQCRRWWGARRRTGRHGCAARTR